MEKKGWLSWLALCHHVRTCYNFWRKRYRNKEVSIGDLSDTYVQWLEKTLYDQSEGSWETPGSSKEAKAILDWALGQMSPEDRMVLELVYLEGHTGKEAADLMGWSLANVKVRAFRARKKLRDLLIKNGWEQ